MIRANPLRDMQDIPPRAHCPVCGAELYEYDAGPLCPACEEEANMEENLKRVIDLAAQLQEALAECPGVLSVHLHNPGTRFDGVHVYRPEVQDLGPMEADPAYGGTGWVHAVIGGVRVFGALHESKEDKNE